MLAGLKFKRIINTLFKYNCSNNKKTTCDTKKISSLINIQSDGIDVDREDKEAVFMHRESLPTYSTSSYFP